MSAFYFKYFSIHQEGVAMRVNTDGVLLGAWVCLPRHTEAPKVLDIGTGSGVIALMLAQRLSASNQFQNFGIDAVEPHRPSAQTAQKNFDGSPWVSHLRLFKTTLQEYATTPRTFGYDLILSNPPYFEDSLRPPEYDRRLVRHTDSLSHTELLQDVADLLDFSGCFGVILPTAQQKNFIGMAISVGLHLRRETMLYTLPKKSPKRVLMEFIKQEEPTVSDSIVIHEVDDKSYSAAYKELTKDFYLAF